MSAILATPVEAATAPTKTAVTTEQEIVMDTSMKSQETPIKPLANGYHISPASNDNSNYIIKEEPLRKPRKIKVIAIGAGASALNFGHEVNKSHLDIDYVCYDKNPIIGGTWYENRYPGCACDIPSVCYQFSWAPSPEWSTL